MKNFWLERAEKKEAAAMEQSIEKILDTYFSYVITPLTMDTCGPCSTITVSIGYLPTSLYASIGTVVASIDADGFARDAGNTMITCSPQLTGFVYTDSSFQKESERVEAQGWVLDV